MGKKNKLRVFQPNYFDEGLRLDPECRSLVVYISDINSDWVKWFIAHPYQSNYVLRVLNSLLHLRFQTTTSRETKIAEYDQAEVLKGVSDMDLCMPSQEGEDDESTSLSQEEQIKLQRQKVITQQQQVQRLVHGTDTNIDQDMWRLYEVYKELHDYEDETSRQALTSVDNIKRCVVRSNLPKSPRLQLMLRNDETYLQPKEGVKMFDEYREVPEGSRAPPSPILSALPQPRLPPPPPQQCQSEQSQSVEDVCLRWAQRVLQDEQESEATGSVASHSEDSSYHVIDLPDIDRLRISD
ncbi:hypothetical protein BGX26_002738 [Mortierella sp. AD094]|nr:hypothetical protein BGX26_002738 [Mortierella sp. AD094]